MEYRCCSTRRVDFHYDHRRPLDRHQRIDDVWRPTHWFDLKENHFDFSSSIEKPRFTCENGQDESNDEQNEGLHYLIFDEQVEEEEEEEVIRSCLPTTVILYSSVERERLGASNYLT